MKRLFALLSAAVMLLSAGCADNKNAENAVTETTAAVTQTAAETTLSSVTETTAATKTAATKTVTTTAAETTAVSLETAAPDAEDAPPLEDEVIPDYAQYYEDDLEDADYEVDPELPEGVEDYDIPAAPAVTKATTAQTTARTTVKTTAKTTATTAALNPAPTDSVPAMEKIVKKYSSKCAVLLYSMDGSVLYSHRPDAMISGASLIKLPYVVFCCQQIEKGVRSLSDTLKYTSSFYHGGSGIIRKNGYGKVYTISQLIDYTLRYSDNVGYDMLVYLFGTKGFNQMVADWGYSVSISAYHRFPAVSANFMKTSMENMQEHCDDAKCWRTAWAALNGSVTSRVREQIGTAFPIAVKYGSISAQYHETCYIASDTPYILVILSPATKYKPDVTFVKNIAKTAVKIVNEHEEAKLTATTTTTVETTTTFTTTTAETTTTVTTTETTCPLAETTTVLTVTELPEIVVIETEPEEPADEPEPVIIDGEPPA